MAEVKKELEVEKLGASEEEARKRYGTNWDRLTPEEKVEIRKSLGKNKGSGEYDYNGPIEKTSVELAKMILAKIDEVKDSVIIESFEKADPKVKAAFIEKSTDMSIAIMNEIAKSDVPHPYATRCIDKLIVVLESTKQYIEGTITQQLDEFVARSLGVRDPDNNKFTKQQATVGDLMLKLEESRKATGGDKYDYFTKPPEEEKK